MIDSNCVQSNSAATSPVATTDALRTEIERNYPRIYRFALSLLRDPSDAEDATQESFLRAYRHIDDLRDQAALTTWLYRITTRTCIDRIRRDSRAPAASPQTETDDVEDHDSPSLQQIVERGDMSACVQRYVDDLSDSYRSVILMHDLEGLTSAEIAAALGIGLATAKMRLHRARMRLRTQLESGCLISHDERRVLVCEPTA